MRCVPSHCKGAQRIEFQAHTAVSKLYKESAAAESGVPRCEGCQHTRHEDQHSPAVTLRHDPTQRLPCQLIVELLRVQQPHRAQHGVCIAAARAQGLQPCMFRLRRARGLARRTPCQTPMLSIHVTTCISACLLQPLQSFTSSTCCALVLRAGAPQRPAALRTLPPLDAAPASLSNFGSAGSPRLTASTRPGLKQALVCSRGRTLRCSRKRWIAEGQPEGCTSRRLSLVRVMSAGRCATFLLPYHLTRTQDCRAACYVRRLTLRQPAENWPPRGTSTQPGCAQAPFDLGREYRAAAHRCSVPPFLPSLVSLFPR